ncbi:unnamed protein product [Closterium sp. NIES-54]
MAGWKGRRGDQQGGATGRAGQRDSRSLPLPDDPTPQQLREWVFQRVRPGDGGFGFLRTEHRRQQNQQETFSPHVLSELFPQRCVTGSVEAAALGASESAATLGASEPAAALGASGSAAALGARASPATGPSSSEALHTFTLDSCASHCFFRDCTTLTPLAAPVPVSLADPTGGPVVAQASTVLPCPAVPYGSLSGLHLPTFLINLVSNAAIQDVWVDTFILGGQCVAICTASGTGFVLGGQDSVALTGHSDASRANDQATQRSSQGYTFSLGSGSVSWRSTRSSCVLGSSCEAEIYAGAMAAQELRWLTYMLTDLGERPHSPPVLYVDNKAMLALYYEQRLEHKTKHIALCCFFARELQQRRQFRVSYVASRTNTGDVFTKALGLVPTMPHLVVT